MLLLIYLFCVFICIIPASNSKKLLIGKLMVVTDLGLRLKLQSIWTVQSSLTAMTMLPQSSRMSHPCVAPTCSLLDPPLSSFVVCVWFLSFLCVEIEHEVSLNMNTKHHMVMKLRHKFGVACSQFRRAQSPFTFSFF